MKKISILLFALIACAFAINAQPAKAPARSQVYPSLPAAYQQLDESKIYYSIDNRRFASSSEGGLFSSPPAGPGYRYAISILGEIDGSYYSSTYGTTEADDGCGAGFLAAFKVGSNSADFLNSATGTTLNGVTMTARIEAAGEEAALITYTLTNNNNQAVTVSSGVYADIMIGDNDNAPLERLVNDGNTYGLKLKYSNAQNAPLMCALFGDGVTGVTPADDYWFGRFDHNYTAEQLVGDYSDVIWDRTWPFSDVIDENYMKENGNYDSGMGLCWKNRYIPAGESIELSYIICVGEYNMEEPFVPGDDRFEYEVEAYNFEGWNDLSVAHPAHVWGYYEHPYGQNGYIEFMVDGNRAGEWARIPGELVSGEEFDLPFDMYFDEDITTTHTLSLRFNDGLGNTSPMDGLSWTDVRSIPVNGIEDRVYNGEPQIFEVTVGDGEPFTIGEDGEYTDPGTYSYGIEGVFAENTIGVNDIEFAIDKGQSVINVTIPEDCEYDGEGHAATVVLLVGDGDVTVTYVNTETGEILTDAPVEPGTYAVFVEVAETNYYYGIEETSYGTFTIDKVQTVIKVTIPEEPILYDGDPHGATVEVIVGDGEPIVTYVDAEGNIYTTEPTEEGVYEVFVEVPETDHYKGIENTSYGQFEIYKKHTALEEMTIGNKDNGAWYTIDGRRVTAPTQSGIYIHNGRKYIVK